MPDQPRGDAFVIKNGKGAGRRLPGTGTGDGTFAGKLADFLGRGHVLGPDPAFAGMVTLHPGAGAADRGATGRVLAAALTAFEPVAERHPAFAFGMAGAGGFDRAHAFDRKGCGLGAQGAFLKRCGVGGCTGVEKLQRRGIEIARQLLGIGQAQAVIDRGGSCHGDGAPGHGANGFGAMIGARNAGLTPGDQHPQPDFHPLGAFGMFQPPLAHVDAGGTGADRHRFGFLGAFLAGGPKQGMGQVLEHVFPLRIGGCARPRNGGQAKARATPKMRRAAAIPRGGP